MQDTHNLKVHSDFFPDVIAGRKMFEMRVNDRDFKVGDLCLLYEVTIVKTVRWPSGREILGMTAPTGLKCLRQITYILNHEMFKPVPLNWVILGLKEVIA